MEYLTGVSADAQGNSYMVGYTMGPAGGSYYGWQDGFVRKYDTSGSLIWQRQVGTSSYDGWYAGSANAGGDFFVTGETYATLAGGTSGPRPDTTLAKYNSAGSLQWMWQYDMGGIDSGRSIIPDAFGNVYVSGSLNSSQRYLVKLAPDGTRVWSRELGLPGLDESLTFAGFDVHGNVIFAGTTQGALAGTWHGGWDIYAGRCDPDGNISWIGQYGSSGDDHGIGVLDSLGNLTLMGYTVTVRRSTWVEELSFRWGIRASGRGRIRLRV